MSNIGKRNQTCVLRYPGLDFGYRYLVDIFGDIYDVYLEEYVSYSDSASHGYWSCYLCDANGKRHCLEVHRIVANTWIGDISGKDVHHKNHDRLDCRVINLEILDVNQHGIIHNRGEANPTSKLNDEDVHQICELLVNNVSCRDIARIISRKLRKNITTESIEKISCKKNWTHISDKYNITVAGRETMNEFRNQRIEIAKMAVNEGLSTREIAERLGVPYKINGVITKRYKRLVGCIPRYVERYKTTTDMWEPIPGGPFEQFIRSKSGRKRTNE